MFSVIQQQVRRIPDGRPGCFNNKRPEIMVATRLYPLGPDRFPTAALPGHKAKKAAILIRGIKPFKIADFG
jgi:hypothetical protein